MATIFLITTFIIVYLPHVLTLGGIALLPMCDDNPKLYTKISNIALKLSVVSVTVNIIFNVNGYIKLATLIVAIILLINYHQSTK